MMVLSYIKLSRPVSIGGFFFSSGAKIDPVGCRLESASGDVHVYLSPKKVTLILSRERAYMRREEERERRAYND